MPIEFYENWVDLYDLMVDWDARLGREGPALVSLLRAHNARKVLDVACGTGRHVAFLANAGFDAAGADISRAMLSRAAIHTAGTSALLFQWSMADEPTDKLRSAAPFDAILCLGNSFPHLAGGDEIAAALANFHSMLRPGGLLVLGFKALAVLKTAGNPFLPLVRRQDDAARLLFVRFYDFQSPGPSDQADFHLLIIGHEHKKLAEVGGVHHAATTLRVWHPDDLVGVVIRSRFEDARVARNLAGDAWGPQFGEDVFITARRK